MFKDFLMEVWSAKWNRPLKPAKGEIDMARCPDCNKFVPNGEPEAELQSEDLSYGNDSYEAEVRVMIPCGECGTELSEYNFSVELEIDHLCEKSADPDEEDLLDSQYELVDTDVSVVDEYETKDKNGKIIKNQRYQKHMYGYEISVQCKCLRCQEIIVLDGKETEQSSAFESLV